MRRLSIAAAVLLVVATGGAQQGGATRSAETPARQDLVIRADAVHTLTGGRISAGTEHDGDGSPRQVTVKGDRIAAVGGEGLKAEGPDAIPGGHVYPGFTDAHGHLAGLGASLENVDLTGTKSYAEVVERVRARAASVPKGGWVLGRGWDQNDWPAGDNGRRDFPDHRALSEGVPEHAVWLTRVDGHAALANMRAMEAARVARSAEDPSGGKIHRFEDGEPTGVFIDRAMPLVGGAIPAPSRDDVRRRYLAAQEACLKAGLTSVHDAGISPSDLSLLETLEGEGLWKLRVYGMLHAGAEDAIKRGPWKSKGGLVVARAVKGHADGALGSRGAALLQPYSDDPGNRGLMTTSPARLRALAKLCRESGMQLCVHAIGDRGNREVLDAFEEVFGGSPTRRWRIEHAQVVALEDFARFKKLELLPSMQPTHCTSDMPWAPARLGPERVKGAYAWRRFLDLGIQIPGGSDFPVESHDPRKGLFAAVTTRAESGGPSEGYRPDQKMTRREALLSFTRWAAFAAFEEEERGAIRVGMAADFTVFDRDLEKCPEEELLVARVLMTVVGGRVVFRAGR